MARLTLALAVLLLGAAGARAEDPTYTACATDNDCVSEANSDLGQTTCMVYDSYTWTDDSDSSNPVARTKQFGICVQCQSDCDCGVNEWCMADATISSQWWSSDDESKGSTAWLASAKSKLASLSNGDMKAASKCVAYGDSDAESDRIGAACNPSLSMSTTSSNDPAHADQAMTCGYVSAWQPEYIPCTTMDGGSCLEGDNRIKNPNWNKPGVCAATVNNNPVVGCSTSGIYWSGACVAKECRICSEGANRCSAGKGIDQTCIGGQWVASAYFDGTARTVSGDVASQALAAMVAFMALIVVIGCFSCLATARSAKNMQKATEA